MSNPRTPSEGEDPRAALERELEQRRGRAPEPGEIFVLSETAELPVEWALLEARPKAFLAIPADTQPLAGSRDFALSANVLSGPLVLRCGHAAEIAASRLRPELRTGLLDPRSLAAARSLQKALAAGTAEQDPVGEEIDRDPEYRDWVEEVLDPARAVLVGLESQVAEVIPIESRRSERNQRSSRERNSSFRKVLPWLAAAGLAIAFGWSRWELRAILDDASAARFDEPSHYFDPGIVRGETEVKLPPATGALWERVRFAGTVPSGVPENIPVALVVLGRGNQELARSPDQIRELGTDWSISLPRSKVLPGPYRIEFRSATGKTLSYWDLRILEPPPGALNLQNDP